MVRATKPAIALQSETGLVGVRVRCPESTQRDSEVHGRGVRGTEGRSLGRKHRERSLPLERGMALTQAPTTSGVFYERKMMDHGMGIHCALREITSSVSRVAPVTTVCARPGAAEPHFVEIFSNTLCDRGGGI